MDVIYKIESFEEDYAICTTSDNRTITIPFEELPSEAVIGSQLKYVEDSYQIDDF
ncbi:MAG: DUF3006 domain-containing protein [Sphaerochaetaceae bacterium]|jgi:hypothetical protein